MNYLFFLALVAVFFISAHPAKALPAPDFIFSVGTQIVQFFTIATILLSAAGSMGYQFFKKHITKQRRVVYWLLLGVIVLGVSAGGAWLYGKYAQEKAMKQWIATVTNSKNELNLDTNVKDIITEELAAIEKEDNLDQLAIGSATSTQVSQQPDDEVATFIRNYYKAIADHQFETAYEFSKKAVSLDTFKGWYAKTDSISIDKIQRIDEKRSSLELTLIEGETKTRYGVLMDVRLDSSGKPLQIENSSVRVLGIYLLNADTVDTTEENFYWNNFAEESLSISNDDFQSVLKLNAANFVLDARENIEFENGHFPGATHIRFADLKAGRWIELPTDKPIYVFCWSGIRGKEVTEFLRSKKLAAQFLESGASGWFKYGGAWDGDISFLKVYTEDRYTKVFTTNDVKNQIKNNVTLIDTRSPNKFAVWHIPGSINIPLMSTPSILIDQAFAQVPPNSKIITVCDGYVNCFDAKLTGVELERRGHTFLGRFAEPWTLK